MSDFFRGRVSAVDAGGREREALEIDGQPSGLGWLPDGSLLVVSMLDRRVLRRAADGTVTVHADLSGQTASNLNDLVVAADGVAYAGSFGFDADAGADPAPGALHAIAPSGRAWIAADGLRFPNGAVVTADGAALIVAETAGARLTAFALGPGGRLGGRRTWAQVGDPPPLTTLPETLARLPFGPDGITLDAAGRVWAADIVGGRCARIAPGGDLVDELPMPAGLTAIACMLGGDDGRTLLVTAAPDFQAARRRGAGEAVLLTATVDVPHAGRP